MLRKILIGILLAIFALLSLTKPVEAPRQDYDHIDYIDYYEIKKQIEERYALQRFFETHRCKWPLEIATTFVRVAHNYNIPYSLLPSISGCESSFGKNACGYNIFGWDSCRTRFDSCFSAIDTVGKSLATHPFYKEWRKDKGNIKVLASIYCPVNQKWWANCVQDFMEEINSPLTSGR